LRGAAVIAFLLVEALALGQGFNRRYDAFGNERPQTALGIERTHDGYCVLSGGSVVDSLGPDQFFTHGVVYLQFVDANGTLVAETKTWRPWHTSVAGWSNCCDTIPGGGFVVGGASEDTLGNDEIYLMRFDTEGDTLWTRVFGDSSLEHFWIGFQVKRVANGDFVIVGITDQNGPFNAFVLRTDSAGNELWREVQVYAPGIEGGLGAIALAENGDFFTSGTVALTSNNSDRWVQRLSPEGTVRWQVAWGSNWREGDTHLDGLSDGHLLVSGGSGYAANLTLQRPYLAKLDSADGSILWEREYGQSTYSTQFFPAKECPNGDLIAAGVCYYGGDQQGLMLRTTSAGDSIWMRSYYYQDSLMQDGTGRFYDVLPTADGGFIAAGAAYYSASGNNPPGISQDTWVVKVDSMGCIVPGCDGTGVTEIITNLTGALTVYPNPASTSTVVKVTLPTTTRFQQQLMLRLVSAEGREVLAQKATVGENELDVQRLAPGLYYVHLTNGSTWVSGSKLLVQ